MAAYRQPRFIQTSPSLGNAGLKTLALSVVAVCAVWLSPGCVQQVSQTDGYAEGSPSNPIIISGSPEKSAAAFAESRHQLTTVRYGVLDDLGPKPVWEQFGLKRPGQPSDGATTPIDGASSTTQPATEPTTRPANLPRQVEIVELGDGKFRIIWVLRNYGGSKVTSAADGNTSRRKVSLEPPDLGPIVEVVKQHLGDQGTVTPLPRENTLVMTCTQAMRDSVLNLLSDLDVAPRQVEITAKIFEVSHDFDFQQGAEVLLSRTATNDSQDLTSIFSRRFADVPPDQRGQGSVISLMRVFQDAGVNLEASFQLLADAGLIRVVSEPRMTVSVGQTGYMLAGQELPITSTHVTGNTVQTAVTYKPVGVQLYITPQAVGPQSVKLHAISVVSSVSGFSVLPTLTGKNAPLVNPIIDSREAETAVTIDDGHTLVISGLRMVRTTTRENKVPGLGDLPLLGWLFKNHRSQQQLTDLYFFVTPTLL